jgi:hypothetical protein
MLILLWALVSTSEASGSQGTSLPDSMRPIPLSPHFDEKVITGKDDHVATSCFSYSATLRDRLHGSFQKIVVTHSADLGTVWRADVEAPASPAAESSFSKKRRITQTFRILCAMPRGLKIAVVEPTTPRDDIITTAGFLTACGSTYDYCKNIVANVQYQDVVASLMHKSSRPVCIPEERILSMKDRIDTVLKWISSHPELGGEFISQSVETADAALWGCPKQDLTKQIK